MKDDKRLLNEVLPDPEQARRDLQKGSPRDRTTAHLRRIVAAAAGAAALHLGPALADNTVPGDHQDDKNGQTTAKPPDRPTEPPGYGVVDPMPEPYVNRTPADCTLRIESKPAGATVLVDGLDIGVKTPVKSYLVGAGRHAISVTSADGAVTKNVTVEVKAKKTLKQSFDLRPLRQKKSTR